MVVMLLRMHNFVSLLAVALRGDRCAGGVCLAKARAVLSSRLVCTLLVGVCGLAELQGSQAACPGCTNFAPGVLWGTASPKALTEASGIASSARNVGVLWTHNDGSRGKVYALDTTGALLATFNLNKTVDDLEDIAVGPGPVPQTSYLYLGDIGGSAGTNNVRSGVRLLRVAEPAVDLAWAGNPVTTDFAQVEAFYLSYPDGSYDAETLWVDPVSEDVMIVTKQPDVARVYRVNLAGVPDNSTRVLEFVTELAFSLASGGDISADGAQIALRREDFAMLWLRCDAEPVADALARPGLVLPVIGPPTEPNGEGLAFLRDGTGYVTITEGKDPDIYFFRSLCPMPPRFTSPLADTSGFLGGMATLRSIVIGYPPPVCSWRFEGAELAAETNASLTLSNLTAANGGLYQVIASNASGMATSACTLTLRPKPDLRITEVMSMATNGSVSTADWWELTSFESQPVSLAGWRFNDSSGGLGDPFVFPSGLTINPGESIVFVEGLTPAQFRNWWGSSNVPLSIQIVTYSGSGLGLGASGDGLRLWNATTSDVNDTIASVDFGAADAGVTFNYDPITQVFGGRSQFGVNGVFRAAAAGDIGSPGRILAPAASPCLQATVIGANLRIAFDAAVGRVYSLEVRGDLTADPWSLTGDTFQATNNVRAFFEKPHLGEPRFYRVRVD
jgi:hypothetical protein